MCVYITPSGVNILFYGEAINENENNEIEGNNDKNHYFCIIK